MGIDLGLSRVARLLSHMKNPHKSIYPTVHIAGTNGKGLTALYISLILTASKVRNGKFTSPHMLYYNDCVTIDNEIYPLAKFAAVSQLVKAEDELLNLHCTEFELLTITAFKIFEMEKVDIAIIEVGLGGRLDATNVLGPNGPFGVVVTAITKIGLDHEAFLGNTLREIAGEKAGILKEGIPCVVDGTNDPEVLSVVSETTQRLNSKLYTALADDNDLLKLTPLKGAYQLQNLSVALKVVSLLNDYFPSISRESTASGIRNTVWPGRLQSLTVRNLEILLDGAHNESAAIELGKYVKSEYHSGVIYIIALTRGKSAANLFKPLFQKGDKVVFTGFTQPENMPWVTSSSIEELTEVAHAFIDDVDVALSNASVEIAIENVERFKRENNDERNVVVCGSLYLGGDVLRIQ